MVTPDPGRVAAIAEGLTNGFVNYFYPKDVRNLLFRYLNTFTKRAIGFRWGNVFVGVMISHPHPMRVISIDVEPDIRDHLLAGGE